MYYVYFLIQERKNSQEEFDLLLNKNEIFLSHLEQVYELETFYGDQTLQALLGHAVSFNEQLETFEYIYSLTEETNEGNNLIDDNKQEEEYTYEEKPKKSFDGFKF